MTLVFLSYISAISGREIVIAILLKYYVFQLLLDFCTGIFLIKSIKLDLLIV